MSDKQGLVEIKEAYGLRREWHCTPETPWRTGLALDCLVVHPFAKCAGGGDYYDDYECPICGERFSVEVPE